MATLETVSKEIGQLSLQGSEKRSKEPEASRMVCNYCDGDHGSSKCALRISVTEGAYVNACYIITCGICGQEMKNDLLCPQCKRKRPGRLLPNFCPTCGDMCVDHTPDSCPNKDRPIDPSIADYETDIDGWMPVSP